MLALRSSPFRRVPAQSEAARMRLPALSVALACTWLAACATSSPQGRGQFVAPTQLGVVYSEIGLRMKLAGRADSGGQGDPAPACPADDCAAGRDFEGKVLELGDRLSRSAYELFPGLGERVPRFDFAVAATVQAGTLSNAGGAIIVLDGLRPMALSDDALSFLMAREMGHVIGRHHEEDSGTGILVSVLTGLLMPVTNLIRSAVASWAGSSMLRASYRADQVREADAIALQLLADAGSELHDVAEIFARGTMRLGEDAWSQELRDSSRHIEQLACGPPRRLQGAAAAAALLSGLPPRN